MNIFPNKTIQFSLFSTQQDAIERLNRRTKKSNRLTSQFTDKSFIGTIENNTFRIISSAIGKGAFCVLTGEINEYKGRVNIEIHPAFRILSGILMIGPLIVLIISLLSVDDPSLYLIPITLIQVAIIRFVFIELAFKSISKESLNKLRDILDLEWRED